MRALLVVGLLLTGVVAQAKPVEYYGTPVFYGRFMPNTVDCRYDSKARYGYCGSKSIPDTAIVGFTQIDDSDKAEGLSVPLHTEVVCAGGICKSNYGEPLGESQDRQISYWDIPTGYYLVADTNGSKAFKHGTGPYKDKYPMKRVKVLPAYDDPPVGVAEPNNDGIQRYDVYCNDAGECSYMGRVLMASQLGRFIPKVLSYRCTELFCYLSNGAIAGLNPKEYDVASQRFKPITVSKGLTAEELNVK